MYLLDTNAVSRHLGGRHPEITARVRASVPGTLFLCSIVKAELLFGAWKSPDPRRTLERLENIFSDLDSFPFDDAAASVFGKLEAHLSRQGQRIGPHDTMIAAIALANNLTLITNNTREFSRVPDLKVEDWQAATGI